MNFQPIPEIKQLIREAIIHNKHNVIVIWGELGTGKTTLMLQMLLWIVKNFMKIEPANCKCDHLCPHWKKVLNDLTKFTFWEIRETIKKAVTNNIRLPGLGWDDLAVYFHRSNIQYMHPAVKDFFSKYNFVRPYLANLIITVPNIHFVPEQLLAFATADIWVQSRGIGDFDRAKLRRSFWGAKRSWTKYYDGYDVTWKPVPPDVYKEYEKMRHQHALEAFEKPEEIFVTTMPKPKAYTEEESLF